ncbi:acid phosphatase haloperoxidase-1 [Coleophoma cylindrospora]|uniref:Acid phosphatase haloperoxidase-1 n=1 Tax=Coleophoma cylindrospora TaxID=1849047 RepID=A0A3D8SRA7_9HELO|nr:acid phosphatase haloperoxidase-1 [Coleophoma cylindrospora]
MATADLPSPLVKLSYASKASSNPSRQLLLPVLPSLGAIHGLVEGHRCSTNRPWLFIPPSEGHPYKDLRRTSPTTSPPTLHPNNGNMLSILRSRGGGRVSAVLVLSYVFDWICIIVAAAIGAVFSGRSPNMHPFSVVDLSISYPLLQNTVSTTTLFLVSLVAPAIIVVLVTLCLVPGPTVPKSTPKGLIWRRKLWEWHTGWLGLALSLATTFVITNGMKNLFGKPRPDLLARCNPDVANVAKYAVGGYDNVTGGVFLVSHAICLSTDTSVIEEGFRSFPSGHSSFAAAGLVYLSLFLASKLAITIPFLAPVAYDAARYAAFPSRVQRPETQQRTEVPADKTSSAGLVTYPSGHNDAIIAARNQAAAPPLYLLVLVLIPFFTSIYISATRWSDFKHQGFDILFGYFIGTVTSIFAFRFYHLPMSQGAGWSWGPRSRDRSFWAGVGVGNYAGEREPSSVVKQDQDVELSATEHPGAGSNGQANTNQHAAAAS